MWTLRQLRSRLVSCSSTTTPCGSVAAAGCHRGRPITTAAAAAAERRGSLPMATGAGSSCLEGLRDLVVKCRTRSLYGGGSGARHQPMLQQQQQPGEEEDGCKNGRCRRCRSLCIQSILVVVNFVFLIFGWALILFGIWLHLYQETLLMTHVLRDTSSSSAEDFIFDTVPFLVIWVGLFVAAMSFLGCYGACAENVCFLSFYTVLLVATMAAEIIVASQSASVTEKLSRKMSQSMEFQLVNEYNKTALPANRTSPETYKVTVAWDALQDNMSCCGVHGPQDYLRSAWFNETEVTEGAFVPPSCCVNLGRNTNWSTELGENYCQVDAILFPKSTNSSRYLNTEGCHFVVTQWIYGYSSHGFFLLTVLISTQMTDLILACALMNWVRKKQTEHWWEETDY